MPKETLDTPHADASVGPNEGDVFLRQLVATITGTEDSLPITLTIGGMAITGLIVSGHRYFADGRKKDETLDDRAREWHAFLDAWQRKYTEREESALPTFIHIMDAKLLVGAITINVGKGKFWRARLALVDGFVLGGIESGRP